MRPRPLTRQGPERRDVDASYTVHISPARDRNRRASHRAPDFWALYGFTLLGLLADVFELDEGRIEVPGGIAGDEHLDVVLVVPIVESDQVIRRLIVQALESRFRVRFVFEPRVMDVFVVTPRPGARIRGGIGAFSMPLQELNPASMDDMMRQLDGIMRAGAKVAGGAAPEALAARFQDLPDDTLRTICEQMQIELRTDHREALVLVGRV